MNQARMRKINIKLYIFQNASGSRIDSFDSLLLHVVIKSKVTLFLIKSLILHVASTSEFDVYRVCDQRRRTFVFTQCH